MRVRYRKDFVKVWAFALILTLIGLDKLTTLTPSEGAAPGSQATEKAIAGEPHIDNYPQPVDKLSTRQKAVIAFRSASWNQQQIRCISIIIKRESGWRINADNPTSSAYGLFQLLRLKPGTPLDEQLERGIRYIHTRYGTPCQALKFHDRQGWY